MAFWMVAVFSCRRMEGCFHFMEPSGWLLSFPGGFWMVSVFSWRLCPAIHLVMDAQEIAVQLEGSHNKCRNSSNLLKQK